MAKFNVSGTFLIRNGNSPDDPLTLVEVSAFHEDGSPFIDWSSAATQIDIDIELSVFLGPTVVPLMILNHFPQNTGYAAFEVGPPGNVTSIPSLRPIALGIVIQTQNDRGQCLAYSHAAATNQSL